jgi:dTDP-4-amino-4,6-dideoxygalactose transaminase
VPVAPFCVSSRHLYQILVDRRDEVMLALHAQQVFPGVHYRDNTLYKMYEHGSGSCPRARRASERTISLPMHLRLTRNQVTYVASALSKAVEKLENRG